jgi:glycerol dehydratase small subunit/propanediol dehydratase small subunit
MKPTRDDYPLAEKHPRLIRGQRGKSLGDITLDAVINNEITMEDLRITPEALEAQADIARSAGRLTLALNFERASELVRVPQDEIMELYELLRPGRAKSKQQLLDAVERLRTTYKAERMARFIEEAVEIYAARGLFKFRF